MGAARHYVVLTVCLVTLPIAAPRAAAADLRSVDLDSAVSALADDILKLTRQQPVTVGQFTPTGLPDSNSGPGIEQILKEKLLALRSGSVQDDARFEVKGDYWLVKARNPEAARLGMKEIEIKARIIDKEDDTERERQVEARFISTRDIARVAQLTGSLPRDGSQAERNRVLQGELARRAVFIGGPGNTLISSKAESPYAVELRVKPLGETMQEARPQAAREVNGEAFVDIPEKHLYEVKAYNRSRSEVAVSLTIDGIDVFHFSKDRNEQGQPRFTHFIVGPPGSKESPDGTVTIVGWHNTVAAEASDSFLSFLVTAYGQGAASRQGIRSRGTVGVIHVQFSACKPLPKNARAADGNETGFGPPRKVEQKPVRYEIEPPHDFVSVRYSR